MKQVWQLIERWRLLVAALICAGVVHICATLVMPLLTRGDAYSRLSRSMPANTFVVLPVARPTTQVLPFQAPDSRYAICRFDATQGPVIVRASLPEVGWTFSVYSADGESFYALPAEGGRKVDVALMILPPGESLLGLVSDARGQDVGLTQMQSPTRGGLAVIRAPIRGRIFADQIERDLAGASCRAQRY